MTDDIVSKIVEELDKGIGSEAQVMYLLVEIQKLRVVSNDQKTILDFYRDWVCHIELKYPNAVSEFLDKFEPLVDVNLTAHEQSRVFIKQYPAFFKLDDLKMELKKYLAQKGISTELIDNNEKWYIFAKNLLGILKDCSVIRQGGGYKVKELKLEVEDSGYAKFKFDITGMRDSPICKLKWK